MMPSPVVLTTSPWWRFDGVAQDRVVALLQLVGRIVAQPCPLRCRIDEVGEHHRLGGAHSPFHRAKRRWTDAPGFSLRRDPTDLVGSRSAGRARLRDEPPRRGVTRGNARHGAGRGRARRSRDDRHPQPAAAEERDDAHDVRPAGRRVGGGHGERRPPLRDPHRRRGQLLARAWTCGRWPATSTRTGAIDERGTPEGGPGLHLPRPAQDLPPDEAGDRRGRGCRHRRRHRDPAGHRHPRRGRERALRRVGGALVALPDGRLGGPPAAPDPVRPSRPTSSSPGKHISAAGGARRSGSSATSCPTAPRSTRRARSRRTVAANGPLAVEAILKTLHATEHMSEEEAFAYEQPIGMR